VSETIQPLGRDADYFSVLGLSRKLDLDLQALEPVFHALSRRYHPDKYRLASSRERMIALENSALLNQAYRTLRDPIERAAYLVRLEGATSEGPAQNAPPQDLFEEILEVQELLGEFKFAGGDEQAALRPQLEAKRAELQAEQDRRSAQLAGALFQQWDALPETAGPEQKAPILTAIRRVIDERAYLRRVLDSLTQALG